MEFSKFTSTASPFPNVERGEWSGFWYEWPSDDGQLQLAIWLHEADAGTFDRIYDEAQSFAETKFRDNRLDPEEIARLLTIAPVQTYVVIRSYVGEGFRNPTYNPADEPDYAPPAIEYFKNGVLVGASWHDDTAPPDMLSHLDAAALEKRELQLDAERRAATQHYADIKMRCKMTEGTPEGMIVPTRIDPDKFRETAKRLRDNA